MLKGSSINLTNGLQSVPLKSLIGSVTHQIRTPLSSIMMSAGSLEQILPELFQAHKLAIEHNLLESDLNYSQLELLGSALPIMQQEIHRAFSFFTTLMQFIEKICMPVEALPTLNVQDSLDKVLKHHACAHELQLNSLHVDIKHDFLFKLAPIFIEEFLANCIDNSLRAIKHLGMGEIYIHTAQEDGHNCLYFKDTSKGMTTEQLEKIFSRYFRYKEQSINPGHGLCRLAFINAGIDVSCNSKEGEYTEFKLRFPSV